MLHLRAVLNLVDQHRACGYFVSYLRDRLVGVWHGHVSVLYVIEVIRYRYRRIFTDPLIQVGINDVGHGCVHVTLRKSAKKLYYSHVAKLIINILNYANKKIPTQKRAGIKQKQDMKLHGARVELASLAYETNDLPFVLPAIFKSPKVKQGFKFLSMKPAIAAV